MVELLLLTAGKLLPQHLAYNPIPQFKVAGLRACHFF